ncbi:TetR/AcrR family transcriptional regulator [Streptomyces sp. URMC 129]|uniref:TetR/AcrR family transcriptional regulator n=1 Tax=Streptomyces sp. URMC 129 TaxID=3423407 RepID=UPI003F1ADB6B
MNSLAEEDDAEKPPALPVVRSGRTGRRPGDTRTRDDILRAARRVFAQHGYSRAKMRDIAREANVNSALIHHFFESKEGVFLAAIQDVYSVTNIINQIVLPGPVDQLGTRLLRGYLELWQSPATREPMLAVVRSAISNDEAADLMASFLHEHVLRPVVEVLNISEPELRATLIGSQLVGIAVIRYAIKVEPLASFDHEKLSELIGPTIQRYLTADLNEMADMPWETTGRERRRIPAPASEPLFLEPDF